MAILLVVVYHMVGSENRDFRTNHTQVWSPEKVWRHTAEQWPEWKQRFERFRVTAKLEVESESAQISSHVYRMGLEAEHIIETIPSD